jgi:predicted dehydrogenase
MKIAFFGVSGLAQPYLDALARRSDAAVTAVCDPDRRAAELTAAGWRARVFPDPASMLAEAKPDAAWICGPPRLQTAVVRKAVELGVPFLVTPPGATDFASAADCGRLARAAKLVASVGFLTRHVDVVQEAREYLGANPVPLALGWWLRPPSDADSPANTTALDLLWNDACRLVDALRFFCGEVTRVHALTPANAPGGLVVQLQFASGGVAVVTCAAYPRPEPRVQVELLGDGWSLEFGGPGADLPQLLAPLRLTERDRTTTLRCLNAPAADHAAAFLAAVAAGNPAAAVPDLSDALATLAVCHAAALSVKEGKAIDMSDVTGA